MDKLAGGWQITNACKYVALVFLLSLIIRGIISCLRALELAHRGDGTFGEFRVHVWHSFRGFHPRGAWSEGKDYYSDYWLPFIIGWLELAAYPIIMATGTWEIIGAWIGLKTLAQWRVWGENRSVFNRYLIGSALPVLAANLCLVDLVVTK